MNLPHYESYKDSGIPWLGEIPAHWERKELKRFISLKSGETINYEKIDIEGDYPVYGGNGLRGYAADFTHQGTYVLIGRQGALCGNINYAKGSFFASEHAIVVTPKKKLDIRWLGELLRCMNLNQYSISAAQPGLSIENIERLSTSFPPLPEQHAIAAYLDERTAKLGQLIANKREQISQLETLRKITIHDAVTKGLNPDAPMKDSGIPWLGEIPAHWKVKRLKTCLNYIEQGWSPQCENRPAEDNEWAVLKVGCVNGGIFSKQENKALPEDESPKKEYLINKDDVLVSRANTRELLGSCCLVEDKHPRLILCDKLYRLNIQTSRLNKQFFIHFMQTKVARYQIESKATGASDSMQNIAQSVLEEMLMAVPGESDQRTIAAYLDERTAKLDQLIANKREQITQLETLRKVTIHDAVTGNIKVPGVEV